VTLKLLSYNIRFGGGGREQALAETIVAAAPDVVVFQEAIDPRVIERLSAATNFPYWAARRSHSIGFKALVSGDRSGGDQDAYFWPALECAFLEVGRTPASP
jgi:endonuclease/exonuclease/phosphatase family metal-dependent hydrolase